MRFPGHGMGWKTFAVALKNEWTRDKVSDTAGAVTFFLLLSLFPFVLFLLSLASLVIDPKSVEALLQQVEAVAPSQVTEIVRTWITSVIEGGGKGILTFGALAAIWAASSGVVAVMTALNTVYGVEESRPFWKVRPLALAMTFGVAVFAVAAAFLAVATPSLAGRLGDPFGTLVTLLRLPVAGLLMMFLWAVLYYALPNVKQEFKFITPGSVVGVLLWVGASWGFSLYVSNFGKYEATYGALGGVVVLLLWIWISMQVFLLGAEINAVIEHKSPEGKAPGAKTKDEPGLNGTKTEVEEKGAANLPGPKPVEGTVAARVAPPLRAERSRTRPARFNVPAAAVATALGLVYLFTTRRRTLGT